MLINVILLINIIYKQTRDILQEMEKRLFNEITFLCIRNRELQPHGCGVLKCNNSGKDGIRSLLQIAQPMF